MKTAEKDILSPTSLFFGIFFIAAAGLYIYDVRGAASIAFYVLISLAVSIFATSCAEKESGDLPRYFALGAGSGTEPWFCAVVGAITSASLVSDIFVLSLRISAVYGGYFRSILLICTAAAWWAAFHGAGAISGAAQVGAVISAVLFLFALFSGRSPDIYINENARGALCALGGMGAVFCLVSHTRTASDPSASPAYRARAGKAKNRPLLILCTISGAFIAAALFHALTYTAVFAEGMKIFALFAAWSFSLSRIGALAFTLRDCVGKRKNIAVKTAICGVSLVFACGAFAACVRGGAFEALFFEVTAVINGFFPAMLAADIIFSRKKRARA